MFTWNINITQRTGAHLVCELEKNSRKLPSGPADESQFGKVYTKTAFCSFLFKWKRQFVFIRHKCDTQLLQLVVAK